MASPDAAKPATARTVNGLREEDRLGSAITSANIRTGLPRQVVMAPVGEHSAKPEEVRGRIERLFPGPYLELYGRKLVPGWTVWGNEIARGDMSIAEAAE
jgi:N6-adenosine-specific RNA methylase IME4